MKLRSARLWLSVALLAAISCAKQPRSSRTQAALHKGLVTLYPKGKSIRVEVELAESAKERARGLMQRKKLAPFAGMLFVFDKEALQSFWMQNTYIPLDIIFINNKLKVVGIVRDAAPLTKTSRRVPVASRYVLEVNGGFCKQHNVTVGTPVKISD